MNERIKELLAQAGYTPRPGFDFANSLEEVFLQKFAELIIEECCRALHPMLRDMISRGHGVDLIKEHFGDE